MGIPPNALITIPTVTVTLFKGQCINIINIQYVTAVTTVLY